MGNISDYKRAYKEDEFEGMEFVPVTQLIDEEERVILDSVKIVTKKDGSKGVFCIFGKGKKYTWSQAQGVITLFERMDADGQIPETPVTFYRRPSYKDPKKDVIDVM